jgi:hypothetical protein
MNNLYDRPYKSSAFSFLSENVMAIRVKFTMMIHISFATMWLFFHKVSVIFNISLTTLSKMLCTSVVKFPASTLEHITNGTRELQTNCDNTSVE